MKYAIIFVCLLVSMQATAQFTAEIQGRTNQQIKQEWLSHVPTDATVYNFRQAKSGTPESSDFRNAKIQISKDSVYISGDFDNGGIIVIRKKITQTWPGCGQWFHLDRGFLIFNVNNTADLYLEGCGAKWTFSGKL